MKSNTIKLVLVDPVPDLCDAWLQAFEGLRSVAVVNGYFEDLADYDCMVSAGNSFGLMDGGVDLAIILETESHWSGWRH